MWRDHGGLFIQGLSRLVKPYLNKGCDGFGPVWRKVFHLPYRYRRLSETLGPFSKSGLDADRRSPPRLHPFERGFHDERSPSRPHSARASG